MNLDNNSKWNLRFLYLAKQTASWSKDPSTQVGAGAINPDTGAILSVGYNGFPRHIDDDPKRYEDRDTKYKYIVHAEMNAIFNANYNGVSLNGSHVYIWPLPPCIECAKGMIQCGVKKIVFPMNFIPQRWNDSCEIAHQVLEEAGVKVVTIYVES
jgi:dCMP deaminase